MTITAITVPKWGLSMEEGLIASWTATAGSTVEKGNEIVDIESSKIANAVEAPATGILRRIIGQEGQTLPIGALIGVIADASDSDAEIDAFVATFEITEVASDDGAAGPAVQTADAGGIPIAYVDMGPDTGARSNVVLIHGFGGDRNNWMLTQPALAAQHRVVALDLPGHGLSGKSVGDGTLGVLASAVHAVMAQAGMADAVLIGHSLGAAVALQVAHEKPDSILGVAAICGAGLGQPVNAGYIAKFLAAEKRRDMTACAEMLFANPSSVTRDLVEDLLKFKRTDGVQAALEAIATHAVHQAAADMQQSTRVPILQLWGSADQIVPAPADAPGIVAGTGHMPHLESAAAVNAALLAFLGR